MKSVDEYQYEWSLLLTMNQAIERVVERQTAGLWMTQIMKMNSAMTSR